jgi:hypothetical protein
MLYGYAFMWSLAAGFLANRMTISGNHIERDEETAQV